MFRRRGFAFIGMAVALLSLVACSSSDEGTTVTLKDFSVDIPSTLTAGSVKIDAKNEGESQHELVLVRTDAAGTLPMAPDGSVDEDAIPESDIAGEISDIAPGTTKSSEIPLEPGTYVAMCNIVLQGNPPLSHYKNGMHKIVTVKAAT